MRGMLQARNVACGQVAGPRGPHVRVVDAAQLGSEELRFLVHPRARGHGASAEMHAGAAHGCPRAAAALPVPVVKDIFGALEIRHAVATREGLQPQTLLPFRPHSPAVPAHAKRKSAAR